MRAVLEAAMEPAEDQPDDADVTVGAAVWQFQPQWNQPRIGWMTRPVRAGHVGNRRAAMSRPRTGRMTTLPFTRLDDGTKPQWNQPRIGWRTVGFLPGGPAAGLPQWSQPRIGWVTANRSASDRSFGLP